ncbi:helitron_like_N domain-containing protein [Caerostris extrusa]|uniref:Helitron_like_N domain-containing protein n=1 Tax=Caerostris extrusa TaxID=172846 RepID=A0AAV4MSQ5_CAEEX|nr:helitron_like_N domain-containing protein [Caerostris extrusa]
MGGEDSERALANRVDARCGYNNLNSPFARRIVRELDALLNEHNELLKLFKSHMPKLLSDNHAIVINPDKTPAGEHIRRFNAPVVDDVAGIMVGDRSASRQIVIRRRDNNLQFIADTHRSYDALQYPLIFWKGQDGYFINIKQRDPVTGAETNKNVSSKDYYAYRLMIRCGQDNVILRCRELCQQFMVDMYVKIESERLRYLRHNQQKLRAEEYIHLRDAIANNADTAEIGNSVILPSSYIGLEDNSPGFVCPAMDLESVRNQSLGPFIFRRISEYTSHHTFFFVFKNLNNLVNNLFGFVYTETKVETQDVKLHEILQYGASMGIYDLDFDGCVFILVCGIVVCMIPCGMSLYEQMNRHLPKSLFSRKTGTVHPTSLLQCSSRNIFI